MAKMAAKVMQYDPCGRKCCGFHGAKDTKIQIRRGRRIEKRQWRAEAGV